MCLGMGGRNAVWFHERPATKTRISVGNKKINNRSLWAVSWMDALDTACLPRFYRLHAQHNTIQHEDKLPFLYSFLILIRKTFSILFEAGHRGHSVLFLSCPGLIRIVWKRKFHVLLLTSKSFSFVRFGRDQLRVIWTFWMGVCWDHLELFGRESFKN